MTLLTKTYRFGPLLAALLALLAALGAVPAGAAVAPPVSSLAQNTGPALNPAYLLLAITPPNQPPPGPPVKSGNDEMPGGSGRALPDDAVDKLVKRIEDVEVLCSRVPIIYRIDCMADQYQQISSALPYGRTFGQIKRILFKASTELASISQCGNRFEDDDGDCFVDPDERRIQPRATVGTRTIRASRPLRPIKPEKLHEAQAAATVVLEEATTVLLRSVENSSRRQEQYARIVQAIDSNKVLLRS